MMQVDLGRGKQALKALNNKENESDLKRHCKVQMQLNLNAISHEIKKEKQ